MKKAAVSQAERFLQEARADLTRLQAALRRCGLLGRTSSAPSWTWPRPRTTWRGCVGIPKQVECQMAHFVTAAERRALAHVDHVDGST
jgi:hypothetical protein